MLLVQYQSSIAAPEQCLECLAIWDNKHKRDPTVSKILPTHLCAAYKHDGLLLHGRPARMIAQPSDRLLLVVAGQTVNEGEKVGTVASTDAVSAERGAFLVIPSEIHLQQHEILEICSRT